MARFWKVCEAGGAREREGGIYTMGLHCSNVHISWRVEGKADREREREREIDRWIGRRAGGRTLHGSNIAPSFSNYSST